MSYLYFGIAASVLISVLASSIFLEAFILSVKGYQNKYKKRLAKAAIYFHIV